MHVAREPVRYAWTGAFPDREVPTEVLYDVRLTFRTDGSDDTAQRIAQALDGLGDIQARRLPLIGTMIRVRGKHELDVRIKGDEVHVRAHHRLKGKAMARLVEALGAAPGAHDLQIDAQTPHFQEAYSDRGPCTPCAARTFPGRK